MPGGRVRQFVADDAAGAAGGAERTDGAGDAAGDIKAGKIRIVVEQLFGHLLRDRAGDLIIF
jgi:hypothetical protein